MERLQRTIVFKGLSWLTVFFFLFQQVTWSAPPLPYRPENPEAVQAVSAPQDIPSQNRFASPVLETSHAFLQGGPALQKISPAEISGSPQPAPAYEHRYYKNYYEFDRYEFEDALEVLRAEYASAMILEDIDEEDLEALLALEMEAGIAVLEGEIVLFTSGNPDEIRVSHPALNLIGGASVLAHTHPGGEHSDGPSDLDLNAAGEDWEYVMTAEGIFAYRDTGEIEEMTAAEFIERLRTAAESDQAESDRLRRVRNDLNRFIFEMDALNRRDMRKSVVFRADWTAPSPVVFLEEAGTVVIEAEHPSKILDRNGQAWSSASDLPGYSGEGYFVSGPDTGTNVRRNYATESPELQYQIRFDQPGTYYVWIRGYTTNRNNDEVHVGLNGVELDSAEAIGGFAYDSYSWGNSVGKKAVSAVTIDAAGEHTLNIWMYEDGFVFDKIILTQDPGFVPAGFGPAESPIDPGIVTVNAPAVNALPAYTNQTTITLSGTKSADTGIWIDGVESVAVNSSTAWQATVPLSGEGLHQLSVTARDASANESTAVTVQTTVDTIAPAIVFTSGTLTNNTTYSLTYTVDGTPQTETRTLTTEGDNILSVTATDAAGNTTTAAHTVTLDTIAPVITVTSASGTNSPDYTLAYEVDGVPYTRSETLVEGTNDLLITAADAAGNTATLTYTVTYTPPVITVDPPAVNALPEYTNQTTITLSGTKSADTGIWIDGVESVAVNSSTAWQATVPLSGEGLHQLSVTARDASANESTAVTVQTTLDTIAPAIVFTSGTLTNNAAYSLTYTVDGTPQTETRTLTAEGDNILSVTATDAAGNTTTATHTVTLDTIAPAIVFTSGTLTNNAAYSLTYTVDGTPQTETRTLTTEGDNILSVTATDAAGNSTTATHTVTLDTIAPVIQTDSLYFQSVGSETNLVGYWDFDTESNGTTGDSSGSGNTGTLMNGPATDSDHAPLSFEDAASLRFDGIDDYVTTENVFTKPDSFSLSLWVKTTTTTGGKLIGFGNTQIGTSNHYDRHIYMTDSGQIYFGVYPGSVTTIHSPASYNDGQWHHVVASLSGEGMKLFIDGQMVANNPGVTYAENFSGYWRIGYDNLNGWTYRPSSDFFEGLIDDVHVYHRPLSDQEIQTLAGGSLLTIEPAPITTDSLTVDYTVDDTAASKTFTGLIEGENDLAITETDAAGNQSTLTGKVTVDTTPPPLEGPVTLPDGTVLNYSAGVVLSEVTPDGDELFFRADGSLERYRYADGREIVYSDANGTVERYDALGTLIETIDHPVPTALDEAAALRVVLQDGIETYYINGVLTEFRTATGIRITDFTLNQLDEIVDALIVYPGGKIDVIRDGVLLRRLHADGALLDRVPTGFAVREILPDATVEKFVFDKTSQTAVAGTRIFTSEGAFSRYDEMGILRETEDGSGAHFVYDRQDGADQFIVTLNQALSTVPSLQEGDPSPMTDAVYSAEGELTEMQLEDGTTISFAGGAISNVVDAQGAAIADYTYLEEAGILEGLQVVRGTDVFTYDENGFLETIQTAGGTVERTADDTDGDGLLTDEEVINILLEETGGNRLTQFTLDDAGNIVDGIIETREGVKQTVENGVLTGFETVDGRYYDMTGGQALLSQWQFRDGTRAVYGGGSITEILFPDGRRLHTIGFNAERNVETLTEELPDGTVKIFASNGTDPNAPLALTTLITPDGTEIHYGAGGLIENIILPDATRAGVEYRWCLPDTVTETTGEVIPGDCFAGPAEASPGDEWFLDGVLFTDGFNRREFSLDGTLTGLLFNGVSAEIENDQIARIYTRFAAVESPQFDTAGILSGDVDFIDGTTLTLSAGELVRAVRPNGTAVNYANGKIETVEIPAEQAGDPARVYRLIYDETVPGDLNGIRVRLESETGTPEFPLVPYLLSPDTMHDYATGAYVPEKRIAFNGDAAVTETDFKFGEGSLTLDGAGDYLTVPHDSDFEFGTGDWTIDFWVRFDEMNAEYALYQKGNHINGGIAIHRHAGIGRWDIVTAGDNNVSVYTTLATDVWHHVALVRSGSTLTLYENGIAVTSRTLKNEGNVNNTDDLFIGSKDGNRQFFPGDIDELRVTKGLARWNTDFADMLPAEPYQADEATKVLFHFDPPREENTLISQDVGELSEIFLSRPLHDTLADRRDIQSILIPNPMPAVSHAPHPFRFNFDTHLDTAEKFFGEASFALDGTYDSIMVYNNDDWNFYNEDFTIDMRVNLADKSVDRPFIGHHKSIDYYWTLRWEPGGVVRFKHRSGGVTVADLTWNWNPSLDTWYHIALVRSNDTYTLYVNGQPLGTQTNSSPINTGIANLYLGWGYSDTAGGARTWNGYLDEIRISKGSARWTTGFTPQTTEYTYDGFTSLLLHAAQAELDAGSEIIPETDPVEPEREELFFAKFVQDPERGDTYEFASDYFPQWLNVSLDETVYNGGYTVRGIHKDESDSAADVTAEMIDMDGDGLLDRLYADGNNNYWWFQKNTGDLFESAVKWTNVDTSVNSWTLRETAGPHPIFDTDLVDMNGDGLPDRVLTDKDDPNWYIQFNNGYGFEDTVVWDEAHILSFYTPEGNYAVQARYSKYGGDIQDVQSMLIDMDGDGLPDRITRPLPAEGTDPLPHWHFQKNLRGGGFADAVLWEGVDWSFYPLYAGGVYSGDVEAIGASMNWQYIPQNGPSDLFVTVADLVDMNGDGLPDRVLLKNRDANDLNSKMDWYVQFNNGSGFDSAELWDNNVRMVKGFTAGDGSNNGAMGTSIEAFDNINGSRHYLIDLVDVTGDGLPDRVTVDERRDRAGNEIFSSWWVEVNTGGTFDKAVEWTGIYGATGVETSIGQDSDLYHTNRGTPTGGIL